MMSRLGLFALALMSIPSLASCGESVVTEQDVSDLLQQATGVSAGNCVKDDTGEREYHCYLREDSPEEAKVEVTLAESGESVWIADCEASEGQYNRVEIGSGPCYGVE